MKNKKRSGIKLLVSIITLVSILLTCVFPINVFALINAVSGISGGEVFAASAESGRLFEGEGTESNPYKISSAEDWNALSAHINSGGTDYSGKYFKLTRDISVTTVLGTRPGTSDNEDRPFIGTFDGDGHTLNVNINKSGFAAPFAIAHNSTIKNLKVTGTVTSSDNHATGLVGASKASRLLEASTLTIQNVTVSANVSCNSHVAGIVGHAHSANIIMENVVFDGSISASSFQGGMIGWGGLGNGDKFNATFKDCLFAGTYRSNAAFHPVAFANGQGTVTLLNDFYTTKSASGGSPITPSGSGSIKLAVAAVIKDGSAKYFDSFATASNNSNWTTGSTLKLLTDVTMESKITLSGVSKTLDLNGKTLTRTVKSSDDGSLFELTKSTLTVTDTSDGRNGVITRQSTNSKGNGIFLRESSTLNLEAGKLTGFSSRVVLIYTGCTFNMSGGEISGNNINYGDSTTSDGAVRTYNNASSSTAKSTFNMTGGKIINNTIGNGRSGGAVYIGSSGIMNISGDIEINNNTQSGSAHNLYLKSDRIINVNGTLSDESIIGVTMRNGTGIFTSGLSSYGKASNFSSDDSRYVIVSNNGEAHIGLAHTHKWSYSASGNVITATCSGTSGSACGLGTQTLTINAEGKTYDGSPVTASLTFSEGWTEANGLTTPEITYTGNTSAGTYYARITLDGKTAQAQFTIKEASIANEVYSVGYSGSYDGKSYGISVNAPAGSEIKYGVESGNYTLDSSPLYKDAGTHTVYYKVTKTNYTAVYGSAAVEISPVSVTVTVTGKRGSADYDGTTHTVRDYTAVASSDLYNVTKDFAFSGSASASGKDAGTYYMNLSSNQFKNVNPNFTNVTFNVTDGYITVNPISVTVTVTGNNSVSDYNGKERSVSGYKAVSSSNLYDVTKDFSFSGNSSVSRTDAGISYMGLSANQFKNTNPNFSDVTFNVTDGYVSINPIDVVVTVTGSSKSADYAAKAYKVKGYTVTASSSLYDVENDIDFSGVAEVARTDAGISYMGLSANQFKNTNPNFANVLFNVTDGFVRVNRIDAVVTVTGHGVTADYSGRACKAAGYDAVSSSALYDVSKDISFSGVATVARTNAGVTYMGLDSSQFGNNNKNFANVTFNVTDGYVRINPIDATVTVEGSNGSFDYDGTKHTVSGFTATADTALYDVTKDFAFSGSSSVSSYNAGTFSMGLKSSQFKNTNTNFANVTFNVTDGVLTIARVDAVITKAPKSSEPVYDGFEQPLVVAGEVLGGVMYYAVSSDGLNAPSDGSYSAQLPKATKTGSYYVWYKVISDENHYDLSPACLKIVLSECDWVIIKGTVYLSDGVTPAVNAVVTVVKGNKTMDSIRTDENGEYWFKVPAGIYDVVAEYGSTKDMTLVSAFKDTEQSMVIAGGKTESTLKINENGDSNFFVAVGGLKDEAQSVRTVAGVPYDTKVSVLMTVEPKSERSAKNAKAILNVAQDKTLFFFDTKIEQTIGTVTTVIGKTSNVIEIAVPYAKTAKRGLSVFASDGKSVQTLKESNSGEAGTYRVDRENGIIYIYSNSFSTFALGYTPYYHVDSTVSLGSFEGTVDVVITSLKDGSVITMEGVSMNEISFDDVPKGQYVMTVTWEDGAVNTLEVPLRIG